MYLSLKFFFIYLSVGNFKINYKFHANIILNVITIIYFYVFHHGAEFNYSKFANNSDFIFGMASY